MLSVNVSLPSGRSETLKVPELSTVGEVQILAQESFGQKFLRLVTSNNVALTNPLDSLQAARVQEGENLTAFVQQAKIAATIGAFTVWCFGGDRIVTWGTLGAVQVAGVSSAIQAQLRNVQTVQGTKIVSFPVGAFASILSDGSVVTWGNGPTGGDSSSVQEQLINVKQIAATGFAFAAILNNGSVVTWGSSVFGGDSSAVQDQLKTVQQIQATSMAFAAVLSDGAVVTWGNEARGGDSSAVQDQLRKVQQISATDSTFAAVLADGSVVTSGNPGYGGDNSAPPYPGSPQVATESLQFKIG